MFSEADERYLLRAFGRNQVVLFTGAGFSCMAENQLGENLPVGKTLCKLIWKFLDYEGEYDGTPLAEMYQALLSKKIPHVRISNFLNDLFLCKKIPEEYSYITVPFWRRIYTTNIDNLTDETYKRISKKLDIISFPNEDIRERDQFLNEIQLIHLNGKLPCSPEDVTFSFEQFAEAASRVQPLYEEFVRDYCTHPTILSRVSVIEHPRGHGY